MPTIYDQYGRPVDTDLLRGEQAAPTLSGIRNIYSNLYPSAGLTPERLTAIHRQADFGDPFLYLELCEEIEEKDLHYNSVLNKRKGAVSSLEIILNPGSEDPADVKIADFVRRILFEDAGLGLSDHLYDIQDSIAKGFSVTELMWDTEKRLHGDLWWVPIRMKWRDPRWFMFDWIGGDRVLVRALRTEGSILLSNAMVGAPDGSRHLAPRMRSWNDEAAKIGIQPMTEPLAPYKFIVHFAKGKSGLPIRAGLSRAASWAYLFKNYGIKDWVAFCEKYGSPIRVGTYPTGTDEADKNLLLAAVAGIGADMAGIIPEKMKIEFQQAQNVSNNSDLYRAYLQYFDDLTSKLVLGSTLGTEMHGSAGSRAAAGVHREVERDIMDTDARRLAATLNRDLVRPMVDLNFGPPASGCYPKLRLGMPDDEASAVFVANVAALAASGMRIGTRAIREKLHLAEPQEGEEILTPPNKYTERVAALEPPSDVDDQPPAAGSRQSAD